MYAMFGLGHLAGKCEASAASRLRNTVLSFALCAWLAVAHPTQAQQVISSLFDAVEKGQVEANVFGKSTSFDQPMLMLEATNRRAESISLTVPMGTIWRSRDPTYCDVVVLAVEPALALEGGEGQKALSAVYGYCLQPAPGERHYPPASATYDVTEEIASRVVQRVLAAVPADESARRDLSVQVAVWMAQGIADQKTLEKRSGYADLTSYWQRARAYLEGSPPPTTAPSATVAATAQAVGPMATAALPMATPTPVSSSRFPLPWLLCLVGVIALLISLAILLLRSGEQKRRMEPSEVTSPDQLLEGDYLPLPGRRRPIQPPVIFTPSPSRTGTQPLPKLTMPEQVGGAAAEAQPSAPEAVPGTAPLPRAHARPDRSKAFEKTMRPAPEPAFVELIADGGPLDKQVLKVPPGGGLISRFEAEFIVLADPRISAPHLVIRLGRNEHKTTIRDLGSREGTLLNGQQLPKGANASQELSDGDRIQAGGTALLYQAGGPALTTPDGRKRYGLGGKSLWIISREKLPFIQGIDKLQTADAGISSPHALVEVGQTIRICDLNSLNGTMVQGRSLLPGQWVALRDGWTVQVSSTKFTVHTNIAGLPELIAGRYELRRWLSCGGMADIFAVREVDTGVERALKVIRARFLSQSERLRQAYLDAFQLEAMRSQAISHPGFVKVHAAGDDPAAGPYLVMDLINGPSVEELIGHHTHLPLADAVEIACQVGEALGYLHQQHHLVHCDIAPKNLLVDPNGLVYVLDLGIAMTEGERQPDFASDGYMAPELLRGESATPTADVYSLGVTVYEMITGERYRPLSESAAQAVMAVAGQPGDGDAGQILLARAPEELARAVLRALQEDPHQRYAQVDQFLAVLTPYRQGADLSRLVAWWTRLGPVAPGAPAGPPLAQPAVAGQAAPSPVAPEPAVPAQAALSPPPAPSLAPEAVAALQTGTEPTTCPHCGQPVRSGARFCGRCGREISAVQAAAPATGACPQCGSLNRPGARFCGGCGREIGVVQVVAPAASACPQCGSVNRPGARFCGGCGQQL